MAIEGHRMFMRHREHKGQGFANMRKARRKLTINGGGPMAMLLL